MENVENILASFEITDWSCTKLLTIFENAPTVYLLRDVWQGCESA